VQKSILNSVKFIMLDVSTISFSDYHVHVLTSVMKSFFREMKEPLMTFSLYSDFIRAAGLFTIFCISLYVSFIQLNGSIYRFQLLKHNQHTVKFECLCDFFLRPSGV